MHLILAQKFLSGDVRDAVHAAQAGHAVAKAGVKAGFRGTSFAT